HEVQLASERHPHGEHVVSPDDERQEGDRRGGVHHRRIAEQRLAAEGGDDRGDHTEGRQDHDVHLGVTEEPEHVLEQYRITATGGIEEAGTKVGVHQHHGHSTGQYRHDRDQQEGGDQPGPDEHGHFHQRHAGCAHVEHGGDDVDGAHDRGRTHDMHGEHEIVHRWRRIGGGQGRVEGPAEIGGAALHEQGARHDREGERQDPEAQVVHAGQCHVRRADLRRNHPVGETHERRHDGAEHHHHPVHGGHLVEELGAHDLHAGLEQLGADEHCKETTEQEHRKTEPQIHRADVFVVGGKEPAANTFSGTVCHCLTLPHWPCLNVSTSTGCTTSPRLLPQALRS